jgi:hypothetical protein
MQLVRETATAPILYSSLVTLTFPQREHKNILISIKKNIKKEFVSCKKWKS